MITVVLRSTADELAAGAALRNRGLVCALRASGREVVLFGVQEHREAVGCVGLQCRCPGTEPDVSGPAATDPYAASYCRKACEALAALISTRSIEAVLVSELSLHRYFRVAVEAGVRNVAMDMHNFESRLSAEIAAYPDVEALRKAWRPTIAQAQATRAIEDYIGGTAKVVTFASPDDEARFRQRYPAVATAVVNNSVEVVDTMVAKPMVATKPDLIFPASLDYFPNVEAAYRLINDIFPMVQATLPSATLTIAGNQPWADFLVSCDAPGVRVVVNPPDMVPLLAGRIMVVPLRFGGGTRIKLLEAFANRVPAISSAKGAEGLTAQPGLHYWLANDSPEAYLRHILEIVRSPELVAARTNAAFDLVAKQYSWSAIQASLNRVVDTLTA